MSEAELHVLKARLRGGILNKVNRGEYRCLLPTGFVYDDLGNVVLDPDSQVRETITYFFETFLRVGSASQTVKVFKKEGLLFPSRMRNAKFLVFQHLTASTALRMLNNPRYAGAYAYGRRHYRKLADGRKVPRKRDRNDWLACIPDAHPGYITWEQFQQNLTVLETNGRGYKVARSSPPREGAALLQGRAVCGRCGRHLRLRYATRRGRQEAWYVCDRAQGAHGEPTCQSIAGAPIDEAVGALVVASMTPAAVELAWEIRREIEARHDEADRLRLRAIERAQFDADLAQRRFMLVDPGNRLVADTLEHEWNDKLRILADAREQREHSQQQERLILDDAIRDRLVAMTADFKTLWRDPSLANRERKRLLAYIVEDVTLLKLPGKWTTKIHVRFKAGRLKRSRRRIPKHLHNRSKPSQRSSSSSTSFSMTIHALRLRSSLMIGASVPAVVSVQVRRTFGSTRCASHTSHSDTDFHPAATDCATAACSQNSRLQLDSASTKQHSPGGSNTALSNDTPTTIMRSSMKSRIPTCL
ncbi:recombinase family protein [Paraburkholderia sp. LEh10]|nr:recombinase family protein [Paraburkholderia sp. LEh10]